MTLVAGLEAAVLRAVGGEVAVAVQTFGATLASQARAAAPVGPPRRGQPHLRDAITWTPTGATSGTLRLPARALFTDSGTRPHTIRARTPAGLRFYSARAGHWEPHAERVPNGSLVPLDPTAAKTAELGGGEVTPAS